MGTFVSVRPIGSLLILAGLVGMTSFAYAQDVPAEKEVKTIVNEYLDNYKDSEDKGLEFLNKKMAELKSYPHMALSQFGQRLTVQNQVHRIAAAKALVKLLNYKEATFKKALAENPDGAEALKKRLAVAFQQEDPELKNQISQAWNIAFPTENLYTAAVQSQPKIKYDTSLFFLHSGGILLNPYTIEEDEEGKFMLKDSGETDTHFFIEAMYRNRYAWQDKELKPWKVLLAMDYEMRLGFASTENDPSGAVVSGAGDAYMEFSIGKLLPFLNNIPRAKSEAVKWVTNGELLTGFVTDKGAQDLHLYFGYGPVVSVGIPYKNTETEESRRTIEILGGIYFGMVDKPQLENDETTEVKSKNGLPEFALEWAAIWRGDIHFPTGKNGFLTIGGRFISNLEGESINPWTISIGYTIPVEVITDSVSKLFNQ
jgi:hypothetical protein